MHFPSGSNGRNRERKDNRNNGNRLFDTQNNAKGGYPWRGDPSTKNNDDGMIFRVGSEVHIKWTNQHGCGPNPTTHCTTLIQVGCDGTTKPDGTPLTEDEKSDPNYSAGSFVGLRDGYPTGGVQTQANGQNDNDNNQEPKYLERIFQNAGQNQDGTNTIPENEQQAGCRQSKTKKSLGSQLFAEAENLMEGTCAPPILNDADPQHTALEFGMHEDYYFYKTHCRNIERNQGLYTADRKLNRKDASATRQNPNGNRRGFECPEERDYYPWWNPSPWMDVAVLTSDTSWCKYYQQESQNVKSRWYCDVSETTLNANQRSEAPIDQQTCEQLTGTAVWREVKPFSQWPEYKGIIGEPDCRLAEYTPQNALGFTDAGADYATYIWKVPEFKTAQKCVIRIRYNISTEDYPAMAGFIVPEDVNVKGTSNGASPSDSESIVPESEVSEIFDKRFNCPYIQNTGDGNDPDLATGGTGGKSDFDCMTGLNTKLRPRYNRPEIMPFGKEEPYISIALNTDQSGRTFQDRSFVFNVQQRSDEDADCDKIINVATMGKRGNIVQSYPAIEYDWSPDNVNVKQGECLDFHMHGSDFNAAKNPNNGEGWKYSDRTNLMQKSEASHNFPAFNSVLEQEESFFNEDERYDLAWLGQKKALEAGGHKCLSEDDDDVDDENNDPRICGKLNYAPNYYKKLKKVDASEGSYDFISTRNNNFSNRAHTLHIEVGEGNLDAANAELRAQEAARSTAVAGTVAGVIVGAIILAGVGVGVFMLLKKGSNDDQGNSGAQAPADKPDSLANGSTRV